MHKIQEIFDKVIEGGMYGPNGLNSYMCNALETAARHGLITLSEDIVASEAIRRYLGYEHCTLHHFIAEKSNRCLEDIKPSELLAIYKDWDNRPYKEI